MIACRQHGTSTRSPPCGKAARRRRVVVLQAERPRERHRHALHLRHSAERRAHLRRVRQVERKCRPFVGVGPQLLHGRVLQPRFDGQEPDRRRLRRVVTELGGAHRGASGGRRQEPRPEVREEDGVDELGFAAREFRDERDDQLVVLQSILHPVEREVDLRVREVLLAQPAMQFPDAVGEPLAPGAVALEAGRECAWLVHPMACRPGSGVAKDFLRNESITPGPAQRPLRAGQR